MLPDGTSLARGVFLALAGILVVACRQTAQEPTGPSDASATAPATSAESGAVSSSASASATVPVARAEHAAGGGDVDGGRAAQRTFCNEAFTADLDRLREKCATADVTLMQSLSRMAANLCFSDLASGLSRSRVDFDEDAANRCVEMLRQKQLPQTSETDTLFMHFPCDRVLLGTQAEGQPCRFSIECKDGLACVGYQIGGDGTCRKPPKVKEACTLQPFGTVLTEAAAALHHPACVSGAYCDGATCQPRLAAGKGCAKSTVCAAGLSCVMGKCGARGPAGTSCAVPTDCAFGLRCDREADGGSGKCAAKRAEGQDCSDQDSCKGRCDIPKGPDGKASGPGKCVAVCGSG
jgi:hypothetical protein